MTQTKQPKTGLRNMEYVYCNHCDQIQAYRVEFVPDTKHEPISSQAIVCDVCFHFICIFHREKTE